MGGSTTFVEWKGSAFVDTYARVHVCVCDRGGAGVADGGPMYRQWRKRRSEYELRATSYEPRAQDRTVLSATLAPISR